MPLSNPREYGHIRICISSLYIDKHNTDIEKTKNSNFSNMQSSASKYSRIIFGKYMEISGVSLEMSRISEAVLIDRTSFYNMLSTKKLSQLIINPLQITLSILVKENNSKLQNDIQIQNNTSDKHISHLPTTGANDNQYYIDLWAQLSNVEITPNVSQLNLLGDIVEYASSENIRRRYLGIRPAESPTENPKKWWKFAIKAILHLVKGRRYLLTSSNSSSSSHHSSNVIVLGKKYILLYKSYIESKLYCLSHLDVFKAMIARRVTSIDPPWCLSSENMNLLEEIQRSLELNKLIMYRRMVYEALLRSGVPLKTLRRAYYFNYKLTSPTSPVSTEILSPSYHISDEDTGSANSFWNSWNIFSSKSSNNSVEVDSLHGIEMHYYY
jgi:hypothetical protein